MTASIICAGATANCDEPEHQTSATFNDCGPEKGPGIYPFTNNVPGAGSKNLVDQPITSKLIEDQKIEDRGLSVGLQLKGDY